jgi:hypothetical protein
MGYKSYNSSTVHRIGPLMVVVGKSNKGAVLSETGHAVQDGRAQDDPTYVTRAGPGTPLKATSPSELPAIVLLAQPTVKPTQLNDLIVCKRYLDAN